MNKRSYFTNKDNNIDFLILDTNPQSQHTVHCHDKSRASTSHESAYVKGNLFINVATHNEVYIELMTFVMIQKQTRKTDNCYYATCR